MLVLENASPGPCLWCAGEKKENKRSPIFSKFFSEGSHIVQSTAHSPVAPCVCSSSVAYASVFLVFFN